jgi:3-hydroxyacyl-[acyl-carrier-protein] dehydratase
MADTLDINAIRKILPHRYPFLLVDRVLDHKKNESLTAIKNITINEPFFNGHFPHRPVFPGVLTLEAMAQSAALLAALGLDGGQNNGDVVFLFAGADKVKFKRQVEPGDQLKIEATFGRRKRNIWKTSVSATVDGKLCASAEITFTYQVINES